MNTKETNLPLHVPELRAPTIPWGLRDLFFATLLAAGGIVALNLGALAFSFLTQTSLRDNGMALVVFVVHQDVIILGAAWLFSVARYRVGWNTLGLRPFDAPLGCGLSAALLLASYVIRVCYVATALAFGIRLQMQAVLPRLDTTGTGIVLTFIAVAVFAPIVEEIFFRGFLYGGLRGRLGIVGAMLVSTLFFTALHFTLDQFIPIFILGLFLAWLYEKTGSLYPGIFLHIANNAIALIALFIANAAGIKLQ